MSETPELLEIDAKWSLKCDRVNGCGAETIITEPGDDAEFSLYIVPTPKEDEIVAGAILELPANTKENVGVTLRFGDIRRAYTIRACSKEICFSRMALFPDQFDSLKKENALRVLFYKL
ncbi:MAG: invasion associated locus B family protein [Litoreibacter sp.]|nr:invasion associated locus B family protein [Litoreibacter sp.]